ncbi:MAG: YlxM family DNA-binding protein [Oscillospiraceae bacterium]|nr:YlxM family DNA-binding protein [Oscillospiraceae bacterium]MBR3861819.1 YlxM family DNA-binding protein [Oscillospiraceae bacterium]
MDETLLHTLLFDFYGELLTDKQRECYDLHYNSDLSLQEIAEQYGATRQAVWDLIRRGERSLREIEARTGLVARALRRREKLTELRSLVSALAPSPAQRRMLALLDELAD